MKFTIIDEVYKAAAVRYSFESLSFDVNSDVF
jgi:hypothetical protein